MIKNKLILVTGGGGSIGSEIVRQLASDNTVYVLDNNETGMFDLVEEMRLKGFNVLGWVGDVRDYDSDLDFGYIFHAAALKHVTPSVVSPMEYVKTNVNGTHNMIRLAKKLGSHLINISTDKAVNAKSVMGATKKLAEIMVRDAGFISVRFGNVLGSRGSVIPIWQSQIDRGESLTVTDARMTRYVMTIPEAVGLVIAAAEEGMPGEIRILKMGDPVNILSLAQGILKKSGKDIGIKIIGIRPGESLDEKLMTDEEKEAATETDKFYILK